MQSVVIADASPLIALARLQHLHLLKALFREILITDIVQHEILQGGAFSDSAELEQAIKAGWLQVVRFEMPAITDDFNASVEGLDAGEASSIRWAAHLKQQQQAVLLVMDEAKGRAVARRLSLHLIGSAGVLALAKRSGLILSVQPLLEQLQKSGYFLSDAVINAALKMAGE
ncbi:MAG TPA: DUF3368 domain-containing protein [Thiolinea sp.]|nr:DUF3368 domain-containing protein [Thiolinea sp.]